MLGLIAIIILLDLVAFLLIAIDEWHYPFMEDKVVPILVVFFIPILGAIIYIIKLGSGNRSNTLGSGFGGSLDDSYDSFGDSGGGGGD
jgi:hypothetical protein